MITAVRQRQITLVVGNDLIVHLVGHDKQEVAALFSALFNLGVETVHFIFHPMTFHVGQIRQNDDKMTRAFQRKVNGLAVLRFGHLRQADAVQEGFYQIPAQKIIHIPGDVEIRILMAEEHVVFTGLGNRQTKQGLDARFALFHCRGRFACMNQLVFQLCDPVDALGANLLGAHQLTVAFQSLIACDQALQKFLGRLFFANQIKKLVALPCERSDGLQEFILRCAGRNNRTADRDALRLVVDVFFRVADKLSLRFGIAVDHFQQTLVFFDIRFLTLGIFLLGQGLDDAKHHIAAGDGICAIKTDLPIQIDQPNGDGYVVKIVTLQSLGLKQRTDALQCVQLFVRQLSGVLAVVAGVKLTHFLQIGDQGKIGFGLLHQNLLAKLPDQLTQHVRGTVIQAGIDVLGKRFKQHSLQLFAPNDTADLAAKGGNACRISARWREKRITIRHAQFRNLSQCVRHIADGNQRLSALLGMLDCVLKFPEAVR